jgi:hypothetical protein
MSMPDCTHYAIALTIKPEAMHPAYKFYGGTIEVDCTVTVENRSSAPIDAVPFLLYRLLSVEQVRDASGQALSFTQDVVPRQDIPRQQINAVQVSLAHPLPAQASTQIRLTYSGPVCGYPEVWPYVQDHVSTGYTLLRRDVLWFPVVARPTGDTWRDAFNFDLSITVPQGDLVAVANGQTCETSIETEGTRYRWRTTEPDSSPRLTVACAPFQRAQIAPHVALYYPAEDEIGAQVVAKAMNRARKCCTDWFGPLPSRSLNVVEIPNGYGSEASAYLILQTADAFKATSLDDARAYRRALSRAGHEMIHLWGVHSTEAHVSRFLDEGITQYVEALLLKKEIGVDAYWERMQDYRRSFLSAGEPAASVPLAEAGRHEKVREVLSRGKGPWLMCVLDHLIGDRLFEVLRTFFDRHRDCGANLKDFETTVIQVVDKDLSLFFQEWLWSAASSQYLASALSGSELIEDVVTKYP